MISGSVFQSVGSLCLLHPAEHPVHPVNPVPFRFSSSPRFKGTGVLSVLRTVVHSLVLPRCLLFKTRSSPRSSFCTCLSRQSHGFGTGLSRVALSKTLDSIGLSRRHGLPTP